MRQLYPGELRAILSELEKQKIAEGYAEQKNKWAFLAAVITNGFASLACSFSGKRRKPKLVDADDFMTKEYKKLVDRVIGGQKNKENNEKFDKHIQDAKQKGLKGPW